MDKIEGLSKQYNDLISSARAKTEALTAVADKTTDGYQAASKEIDGILGQADNVMLEIKREQKLAEAEKWGNEPQGTQAAHLGWRQSGPDEGNPEIDPQSWRKFSIKVMTPYGPDEKEFRYHVPLNVQGKGYASAFEAYLRRGKGDLGPADRKALSESVDSAGGYGVPEDFQAEVIKKIATNATVRQYARVVTTSRDAAKWPRVRYTTNNEYTSGVRMTWTGESPAAATTHRVTDQVFGEINIPVHTAMASQLISMDLIDDAAFDVVGLSSTLFAEAFGLGENAEFWTGSGATRPRGIITDASDTTNFDANVQTAASSNLIDADEVIDIAYGLPAQYERNARWFMTKATEKALRKLKDSTSDYIWPVKALVGGFGVAVPELLGFPVTRDEFVEDISDATNTSTHPLVFGDLSGYIVLDRVGMSVKRDDNLYAELNQVLLLGKKRVGGQLAEAYKLSLLKTVNST